MSLKRPLVWFMICLFVFQIHGQVIVTGTVVETNGNTGIAFVNIGIQGKNVGTVSQENGTFSITIPAENAKDTLTFSTVGYETLRVPVPKSMAQGTFLLREKTVVIEQVHIVAKKLTEQQFGIRKKGAIHLIDASMNHNDIFEIAQVISLGKTPAKVTSVNLLINEARKDSGIFRINFYELIQNKPGKRIIEKNILQKKEISAGWLKFDLSIFNIYLQGDVVAAIEFIPTGKKSMPVTYEAKLGGSARSFVRKSSQGEWEIPFHHYRLFVTALVPEGKRTADTTGEEKESVADTVMFSKTVNDSIRIFIDLPKGYHGKTKKYPVVFLLDANVYFELLAQSMKAEKIDAIFVGIGYRDFLQMDSLRDRDYTYPAAMPGDSFKLSGGGERFLSFVRDELVPYIDLKYRTNTANRTLMGHSLGGYCTLFALEQAILSKQVVFRNYVAPSPELRYNGNRLTKQFLSFPGSAGLGNLDLFLTYGKLEDKEVGGTGTVGSDNFNRFCEVMRDAKYRQIRVNSIVYPSYMHMETAVPTFLKALREIK